MISHCLVKGDETLKNVSKIFKFQETLEKFDGACGLLWVEDIRPDIILNQNLSFFKYYFYTLICETK